MKYSEDWQANQTTTLSPLHVQFTFFFASSSPCYFTFYVWKAYNVDKSHILLFYILLTVHPNIMIVFFLQLDTQILYFNTFIILLYMFRALIMLTFRRATVLVQHLVSSLSLGDSSVHRLPEDSRNLCTELSPKDSDDTRCCTNTIVLLKVSIISARNM